MLKKMTCKNKSGHKFVSIENIETTFKECKCPKGHHCYLELKGIKKANDKTCRSYLAYLLMIKTK